MTELTLTSAACLDAQLLLDLGTGRSTQHLTPEVMKLKIFDTEAAVTPVRTIEGCYQPHEFDHDTLAGWVTMFFEDRESAAYLIRRVELWGPTDAELWEWVLDKDQYRTAGQRTRFHLEMTFAKEGNHEVPEGLEHWWRVATGQSPDAFGEGCWLQVEQHPEDWLTPFGYTFGGGTFLGAWNGAQITQPGSAQVRAQWSVAPGQGSGRWSWARVTSPAGVVLRDGPVAGSDTFKNSMERATVALDIGPSIGAN